MAWISVVSSGKTVLAPIGWLSSVTPVAKEIGPSTGSRLTAGGVGVGNSSSGAWVTLGVAVGGWVAAWVAVGSGVGWLIAVGWARVGVDWRSRAVVGVGVPPPRLIGRFPVLSTR